MTGEPVVTSPAQRRVLTDVLGWGRPRPLVPDGVVGALRTRLEDGLGAIGAPLERLAATQRGGRIVVSRSLLQRAVCDGWLLAPEPYVHTPVNVRGVLGRAAILADLAEGQRHDPAEVVAAQWRRLATDRPGDPRSLAAWLNATDATVRTALRREVADLVAGVREVWPVLPADRVRLVPELTHRIALLGGTVELVATADLTVASPISDDRARQLVIDLRTGQPRAPLDRLAARFAALCTTLADGVPPFRWSTFYVTEGRFVSEDLRAGERSVDDSGGPALDRSDDPTGPADDAGVTGSGEDPLGGAVERIVATVAALVALEGLDAEAPAADLRLAAGPWCASCRRRVDCPVAAVGS